MIITNKLGLAGRYKVEAVNATTGQRRLLADWFDNLITNEGLNQIKQTAVGTHCFVGNGSNPPSVNDASLQSLVASTGTLQSSNQTSQLAVSPYYWSAVLTYRFAQGAAAGNLSEVGIGQAGQSWIFSRALIKDVNGTPTTVTVTASEFLDISYELRTYIPMNDVTFTRTIGGVNYDVLMRAANGNNSNDWAPFWILLSGAPNNMNIFCYSGNIGATVLTTPSSLITGNMRSMTTAAYVNNSLKRSFSRTLGLNEDNAAGGIRSILLSTNGTTGIGAYQFQFTPSLPKNASNMLTLSFEISWARRP